MYLYRFICIDICIYDMQINICMYVYILFFQLPLYLFNLVYETLLNMQERTADVHLLWYSVTNINHCVGLRWSWCAHRSTWSRVEQPGKGKMWLGLQDSSTHLLHFFTLTFLFLWLNSTSLFLHPDLHETEQRCSRVVSIRQWREMSTRFAYSQSRL